MFNKTILAMSLAGLAGISVAQADSHSAVDAGGAVTDAASTATSAVTDAASSTYDAAASTADSAASYAAPVGNGEWVDDRWYVAPFGTFVQPGGDRNAQGGWGAGLAIGKMINEYFNVEVRGFWQNWGNNGMANTGHQHAQQAIGAFWDDGATDVAGGTIDLQYYFMRDTFSPYAVFGVGGMNNSWRGSVQGVPIPNSGATYNAGFGTSTASFIFEAGVGATYELADNFLLRGDVRYRGDTAAGDYYQDTNTVFHGQIDNSNTSVFNDLLVNVGFVVPFGDKGVAAAPVVADECASRDTDADGVNDCDDKCPGTASGTKVDDQGCPIVMELRGVNFKYDSAELTPGAMTILDGVTEQLVAFPAKKDIEVAGYASYEGKKGKEQHNLNLSQRRSESVAQYLRSKGVTNNMYAKGYGTEYPIADNGTEEGRIKNRRVELRWMGD
jgi:OOP family OmpA-OmpF porin